jgi:hypothetical protein
MSAPHDPRQLSLFAWQPPVGRPLPDLQTLRKELAQTSREVRNLTVMGMRPDLKPEHAELVKLLERSARAEQKLRIRAIEYAEDPEAANRRFAARQR